MELVGPVLTAFRPNFRTILQRHLVLAYIRGDAQVLAFGNKQYEGPPINAAIKYASDRGSKMITRMDEETQRRIARVIADGIENKRGIPGLIKDIEAECRLMGYNPMGDSRAEMIARTETADALEQSFLDRAGAMGWTGKEWIVHDPCPVCQANADLGVIPMDSDEYLNTEGEHIQRPPAHPSCRCSLVGAELKK